MTKEQRKNASIDLSLTYLSSYYAGWRLAKVLTIQKLLSERYEFYKDIISEVKQWDDKDGDATIAQEIKNGLYFDAIAECVQYIEDLFALIKASKNPEYFIRNIITYDAGKVTSSIKSFKPSKINLANAFHYPHDKSFTLDENNKVFEEDVNILISLVEDLVKFYNDYEFMYIQYKHGLALSMRTGNKLNEEQISLDKIGEFDPYLAVYDNLNLTAASKKGRLKIKHGIFMPGFTSNVRPHIQELSNENNLLRLVVPPDFPNFNIELLVDKALKARICVTTFIVNYSRKIKNVGSNIEFQLPLDYKKNLVHVYSYDVTNE